MIFLHDDLLNNGFIFLMEKLLNNFNFLVDDFLIVIELLIHFLLVVHFPILVLCF